MPPRLKQVPFGYASTGQSPKRTVNRDISRRLARSIPNTSNGPNYSAYYLYNLSALARRTGNLAKADEYLQRIFEIQNRISPESHDTAMACSFRALIAVERGDLVLAQDMHSRALAIFERQSPGSLIVSDTLEGLGTIALEREDLGRAREFFQNALAIREKLAPGSTLVGQSLNHLGHVDRRAGRLTLAAERFCRATEVFDQQRKKLGGTTEGRAAFGGTTAEPYHDCLAALIDIGRPEEAFRTLERGRARSFLDLLAERDLRWTADLSPELARDQKQTDAEYDRTQASLNRLSPIRDQAEIDRLLVRLRELRARQEEIAAKIRQTSPRAAALQDPRPLDLAGARAALDPGTVLLAWSIGRERSFLFVVQAAGIEPGLEVFPLAFGNQALRERVASFLNLAQHAGSDRESLSGQARELYDILLRPAEARIAAASRLLVLSRRSSPHLALCRVGPRRPFSRRGEASPYKYLRYRLCGTQEVPARITVVSAASRNRRLRRSELSALADRPDLRSASGGPRGGRPRSDPHPSPLHSRGSPRYRVLLP